MRQADLQRVVRFVDQRAARFHGGLERSAEVDSLAPQLDLPARDSRHVEQIFHQPGHVLRLAIDDTRRPLQLLGTGRPGAQDFYGMADRSQGIPQLVREQGQKLGLAHVRFLELAQDALLRRYVPGHFGRTDDLAGLIADRRDRQGDIDEPAVLRLADRLVMVDPLAVAQAAQDHRLFVPTVRGDDQGYRLTDRLLGSIAEQASRTVIPRRDRAVERLTDDRVVGRFDDRGEQLSSGRLALVFQGSPDSGHDKAPGYLKKVPWR